MSMAQVMDTAWIPFKILCYFFNYFQKGRRKSRSSTESAGKPEVEVIEKDPTPPPAQSTSGAAGSVPSSSSPGSTSALAFPLPKKNLTRSKAFQVRKRFP